MVISCILKKIIADREILLTLLESASICPRYMVVTIVWPSLQTMMYPKLHDFCFAIRLAMLSRGFMAVPCTEVFSASETHRWHIAPASAGGSLELLELGLPLFRHLYPLRLFGQYTHNIICGSPEGPPSSRRGSNGIHADYNLLFLKYRHPQSFIQM